VPAHSVTDLIGRTPIVQIEPQIFAKCEFFNPGGSVKDRIARKMIEDALQKGLITKETPLVEPTSGNTGIGLAMVAASLGMQITIVMPESMSVERRKLLSHLGARLILTPAERGMRGAIERAKELAAEGYYMLDQFSNPANPQAHEETTAQEILAEMVPDIFVAGVGTGGTITGVARVLRPKGTRIVAVEPKKSAVLSGGEPGPHRIEGIGAGFIPPLLDRSLIDEVVAVDDDEAMEHSRWLAKNRGLMVGISSGANYAAAKALKERHPNKSVLTIFPDGAERYISTELFG